VIGVIAVFFKYFSAFLLAFGQLTGDKSPGYHPGREKRKANVYADIQYLLPRSPHLITKVKNINKRTCSVTGYVIK
jgi:hypothetical protein